MIATRKKIICTICGEIFSRHKRIEECAYCGGAVTLRDFNYVEDA